MDFGVGRHQGKNTLIERCLLLTIKKRHELRIKTRLFPWEFEGFYTSVLESEIFVVTP